MGEDRHDDEHLYVHKYDSSGGSGKKDFDNLYFVSEWFGSLPFNSALSAISTRIATEIASLLNTLKDNEYITFEQLIVNHTVTIIPERKLLLKKGDAVPEFRLQGFSFGLNEILFVDVNNARIVHYSTLNDTPASDYNDDYAEDISTFACQIIYNKYQKGV